MHVLCLKEKKLLREHKGRSTVDYSASSRKLISDMISRTVVLDTKHLVGSAGRPLLLVASKSKTWSIVIRYRQS